MKLVCSKRFFNLSFSNEIKSRKLSNFLNEFFTIAGSDDGVPPELDSRREPVETSLGCDEARPRHQTKERRTISGSKSRERRLRRASISRKKRDELMHSSHSIFKFFSHQRTFTLGFRYRANSRLVRTDRVCTVDSGQCKRFWSRKFAITGSAI